MNQLLYRYAFDAECDHHVIEAALLRAFESAEALLGESRVKLDVQYAFDPIQMTCVIDASTRVGKTINHLFVGRLRRSIGATKFRVERTLKTRKQLQEVEDDRSTSR